MPLTTYDIKKRHRDYTKYSKSWKIVKDCIGGEDIIKKEDETYLPFPVALEDDIRKSDDFKLQYEIYKEGAHYTNYTEEALEDLVSGCFRKDIVVVGADEISQKIPVDDIARDMVRKATSYGRMFVIADYPKTEKVITKAEEEAQGISASVIVYEPLQIIDWDDYVFNGASRARRVVVEQCDPLDSSKTIWIEYMIDGVDKLYKIRVHKEVNGNIEYEENIPKANGQAFKIIPGLFCGSVTNAPDVDRIPLLGISTSNIKHYQTFAELIHVQVYTGHPQVVMTGMPKGWLQSLKDEATRLAAQGGSAPKVHEPKVNVGASRTLVVEGDSSDIKLLTLTGSDLVHFKTLEQLEKSMLEQGARIKYFSVKGGVESADTLRTRSTGESSQLAKIATNVERALEEVLTYANQFMAINTEVAVEINKEFYQATPDASLITIMNQLIATGNLPITVLWAYLRKVGIIDVDIDDEMLTVALDKTFTNGFRTSTNTTTNQDTQPPQNNQGQQSSS